MSIVQPFSPMAAGRAAPLVKEGPNPLAGSEPERAFNEALGGETEGFLLAAPQVGNREPQAVRRRRPPGAGVARRSRGSPRSGPNPYPRPTLSLAGKRNPTFWLC